MVMVVVNNNNNNNKKKKKKPGNKKCRVCCADLAELGFGGTPIFRSGTRHFDGGYPPI